MTGSESAKWLHRNVELLPKVVVMGWDYGELLRQDWATVIGLVKDMFAALLAML